jgi:phosphatidylethanolamine-binding protein (PEBP) family uncharacterized protein
VYKKECFMNRYLSIIFLGLCLCLSGCAESTSSTSTTTTTTTTDDTSVTTNFTITSLAVSNSELLEEYQCEARNESGVEASIPLAWSHVPDGTASLVITMTHYPHPEDLTEINVYMMLWGIDPSVSSIAHGAADDGPWFMGPNKDGASISYTSPCSPSVGSHEYTITIYALSETAATLGLPSVSTLNITYTELIEAIENDIIESTSITFDSVTVAEE